MPTIYNYIGFLLGFHSNEHYPIHVHVKKGENESVFELIIVSGMLVELKQRKVRGKAPLTSTETKNAVAFINKYYKNIVDKWMSYFVKNIPARITKITKKI
jgi:hypothetical protein